MAEIERWSVVRLMRVPKSDRVRMAPSRPAPGYEKSWDSLTEIYIPVTELERVCRGLEEEATRAEAFCSYFRKGEAFGYQQAASRLRERAAEYRQEAAKGEGR